MELLRLIEDNELEVYP